MTERAPKVSVITCVYNGERFLRPAIESILEQRFGGFEYWLVNDASTDRSREIISSYLHDSRVRVLDTERNIGPYAAANLALAGARGEYVARVDADDVSLLHRLAMQVEFLEDHPEVGLLGTAYRFVDEAGNLLPRVDPLITRPEEIRWTLLFQNCIAHSTVMYRRRLLKELGFYADGRYSQDYDLWSRMSFTTALAQLPTVCVHYRVVDTGLTASRFSVQQEASHAISRRALARLLGGGADDTEISAFARWCGQIGECSAEEAVRAQRFVLSLAEPFCRRFGYTGRDRERVVTLAREHVFRRVRWKEAEAPRWALAVYLRLVAADPRPRSCARILPAIGKLLIGRRGVRLIRQIRTAATCARSNPEVTSRRLKVLVFPARYPSPTQPFLATPLREHVRAVSLLNDVVVLDAPREAFAHDRPFFSEQDMDDGIPVVRSRFRQSPVPKTTYLLFLASVLSACRRIVRQGFRPDLIHAHMYFIALPAVVLGRWLRIPVVITEHSECYAVQLPWRIRQEARIALALADAVIPVSDNLRALMESQGIRGAFRVIPNPVDTKVFRPSPVRSDPSGRQKRLLFVGRLMPVKGVDILLKGLALLSKVRQDFLLDIVGDGDRRPDYESLARQLGVQHLVMFHGFQPREVVADLMRRSDALVLSSRSENSPTVLVEALASGLPVVVSDVGGVREVVPKEMGVFFPAGDPRALAEALAWMLDNIGDYDPWELAGYARSDFSLEVIGRRLDAVYREVVARE